MSYSWGTRGSVDAGERPIEQSHQAAGPASVRAEVDGTVLKQQRMAAELAQMVDVWQRLLVEHVPDRSGCCRTCTKGGTGLPTTPWPCAINGIAEMARRIHDTEHRAAS
jgi:hypothetical protein